MTLHLLHICIYEHIMRKVEFHTKIYQLVSEDKHDCEGYVFLDLFCMIILE